MDQKNKAIVISATPVFVQWDYALRNQDSEKSLVAIGNRQRDSQLESNYVNTPTKRTKENWKNNHHCSILLEIITLQNTIEQKLEKIHELFCDNFTEQRKA